MSMTLANPVNDLPCGVRETFCGYWSKLTEVVRQIFPAKAAPNLSVVAGISLRSSEYFLAQKSGLSGDAVVSLLNTEHGPEVLAALTAHSDQEWTKAFQKWWTLQKLKAAHAEMQKQIEELSK